MNHPKRASRRHGHLPGHIRETFLAAIEAYEETASGQRPPRIPYEINYRERQISIAEACGLVWGCTDTMPGTEFRSLCDCLSEQPQRQTYAAAAHALLAELKASDQADTGADARMKHLYDQRDAIIEQLEKAIAVEEGYDLTDRLQRGRAAVAADKAIERWGAKIEDPPPVPATPIEELLQRLYRHCEALRDMEEEMAA
jgi:tryptophan 2,3-dioxygenase